MPTSTLPSASRSYFHRKYPIQVIIKDIYYSSRDTGEDPMELQPQESKAIHLAAGPLMTPIEDKDKLNDFSSTVLKADVSQRRD